MAVRTEEAPGCKVDKEHGSLRQPLTPERLGWGWPVGGCRLQGMSDFSEDFWLQNAALVTIRENLKIFAFTLHFFADAPMIFKNLVSTLSFCTFGTPSTKCFFCLN